MRSEFAITLRYGNYMRTQTSHDIFKYHKTDIQNAVQLL